MFGNPKIFPTDNTGNNHRKESLTIDNVINSVEDEIQQITMEADELVAQKPSAANNRIKKNGEMYPNHNNNGSNNGGAVMVGTKAPVGRNNGNNVNQGVNNNTNHDDGVEEIKLSHEVFHSEEKITEELSEHFKVLQKQIEEYRKLYQSAASKLKETQTKLATTEEKLTTTEDEKLQLQEQLLTAKESNLNNNNGSNTITVPNRAGSKARDTNYAQTDAMQKRADELRRALLFENEEDTVINLESILQSKNIWVAIQEYFATLDPFKRDLSLIQSRFGSSVASYFVFTRYLINQTIATATVALAFFIWHILYLSDDSDTHFNDYFDSVGYLPYVMAYSSFSTRESLLYDCVVLIVLIWTLVSILYKLIAEDKLVKTLDALDAENQTPYSKEILAIWDCSRTNVAEIEEYAGSLGNRLLQELEETKTAGIQKARSRYQLFFVYTRRISGFISFLVTVVASFTIILYVTIYGKNIATFVASAKIPGLTLSNVNALIIPLILNVVNGALPSILAFITEKERWDASSTKTNLMMFRLYVASTLNGLLTVFSYLVLADPMLLAQYSTLRNSFGLEENTTDYSCRMDQVAEGLFTLVGFSWAIDSVMLVVMPTLNYLLSLILRKEYTKPEFEVADNMVKRMNFMGLVFASFPFSPMTLIFIPWFLIVGFKYEKNVIKRFYVKPKRPWQGQKAGVVYSMFYLMSFILVGLSVSAYFFSTKTFAKECALQDRFVHLCASSLSTDNVCTLDKTSDYYRFYRSSSDSYPKEICTRSCGPFIDQVSNFSPIHTWVKERTIVKTIWDILLVHPYVPWILVCVISMVVLSNNNTLEVVKYASNTKERSLETQLLSLEAEKKKQEKVLKKLQSIEGVHEDEEEQNNINININNNDNAAVVKIAE